MLRAGDNASLDVVRHIVERIGGANVAIVHAGGAQLPSSGDAYLTLPSTHVPAAARLLGASSVIPIHIHGWRHFSEGATELRAAFAAAGMSDRLALAEPGSSITVQPIEGDIQENRNHRRLRIHWSRRHS